MAVMNPVLWENVKSNVRLAVGEDQFSAWMSSMELEDFEEERHEAVVAVPTETHLRWLRKRFLPHLEEAFGREVGLPVTVRVVIDTEDPIAGRREVLLGGRRAPAEEASRLDALLANSNGSAMGTGSDVAEDEFLRLPTPEEKRPAAGPRPAPRLNPRYLFNDFVVGESNRYAHAAAVAVADPRSRGFNPLFIYGGSGLGKTHLMQAIGHRLYETDRRLNVTYVTSEQFINDFIDSIQNRKHVEFRARYRNSDLLLIDDVQFLMGKERTQHEFFHTFNALHDAGKRVVVTSDRPPKSLSTLEDRLRSRFEWGLLVDIQPPDLETRIAILRRKAQQEGVRLPNEVIVFIAERITENIREMEGALKRLHMASSIHDCHIDLERAREVLGHLIIGSPQPKVTVEDIQKAVCDYFHVNLGDLLGSNRSKRISQPRHLAQYLSRKLTNLSFPDIAQKFGGKDHTSVIYAVRKIERELDKDANLAGVVNYLVRRVTKGTD